MTAIPSLVETPSKQIDGIPAFCECVAAVVKPNEEWSGTVSELLKEVTAVARERGLDTSADPFWPTDGASLWTAYLAYEDFLKELGVFRKVGGWKRPTGVQANKDRRTIREIPLGEQRLRLITSYEDAQRREWGSGSLAQSGGYWVGAWSTGGGRYIHRCLGRVDQMSREEALACLDLGPGDPKIRPPGSGTLVVKGHSWYGVWRSDGRRIKRALGRIDEMTREEAEAKLDQGPPESKKRTYGSGYLYIKTQRNGVPRWYGQLPPSLGGTTRALGKVDVVTREEAAAKLQQLIEEARDA